MSRNKRVEELVAVIVKAQESQPDGSAEAWQSANSLLDAACIGRNFTRQQLKEALHEHVKEFRRQRKDMENLRVPPKA